MCVLAGVSPGLLEPCGRVLPVAGVEVHLSWKVQVVVTHLMLKGEKILAVYLSLALWCPIVVEVGDPKISLAEVYC